MIAAALLLPALLTPQDDEVIQDFKRYFRRAKETYERVEYVYSLQHIDHPGVAGALLPVLEHEEPEVAVAAFEVVRALPSAAARRPLLSVVEEGKSSGALPKIIRAAGESGWSEFLPLLRPHIEAGSDEVRLWTATSLGLLGDHESIEALGARLAEDGNALVRVASADALARVGVGHEDRAGPFLIAALQDDALEAQTAACLGLAAVRTKDAIGPLIDIMVNGEGRILESIYPTLLAITDLQFSDDPQLWQNWWRSAEERYVIPTAEELAKRAAAREEANKQYRPSRSAASFVGVDTPSRRLVFVVDVSGSMEQMVVDRDQYRERGFTRFEKLEIVKEELLRSLEGLESYVRFNIYAFATEVEPWRKGLVPANGLNKRSAADFVRKLEPIGGASSAAMASAGLSGSAGMDKGRTNTYAALLAGLGVDPDSRKNPLQDPSVQVKSDVDTVFFLSDGRPSVGAIVDPDDILNAITELNRFRRVTLHTIAIGEFQKDFMEDLARRNGGVFADLGR